MSGTFVFRIRRPSSQIVDVVAPLSRANPAAAAAAAVAHPCLIAGLTGVGKGNQPTPHTCTHGILTDQLCGVGAFLFSEPGEHLPSQWWNVLSFNIHKVVLPQSLSDRDGQVAPHGILWLPPEGHRGHWAMRRAILIPPNLWGNQVRKEGKATRDETSQKKASCLKWVEVN